MDLQKASDLVFMALVLWREARGESTEAKTGVALAILNRVNRPSWWGTSVTEVLFKKWQFSSVTDPHDPQLTTWPDKRTNDWKECLSIAEGAISGVLINTVPGADSYYDISLDKIGKPPAWIKTARFVKQIGRIKFYDVDRDYQG